MSIRSSYNSSNEASIMMEDIKQTLDDTFVNILNEIKEKTSLAMKKVSADEATLRAFKKKEKRNTYHEFEEALALLDSAVSFTLLLD